MGGMVTLPWSKISDYALKNGFTGAEHDWFIDVIFRIDRDQIELFAEKEDKKRKTKK